MTDKVTVFHHSLDSNSEGQKNRERQALRDGDNEDGDGDEDKGDEVVDVR